MFCRPGTANMKYRRIQCLIIITISHFIKKVDGIGSTVLSQEMAQSTMNSLDDPAVAATSVFDVSISTTTANVDTDSTANMTTINQDDIPQPSTTESVAGSDQTTPFITPTLPSSLSSITDWPDINSTSIEVRSSTSTSVIDDSSLVYSSERTNSSVGSTTLADINHSTKSAEISIAVIGSFSTPTADKSTLVITSTFISPSTTSALQASVSPDDSGTEEHPTDDDSDNGQQIALGIVIPVFLVLSAVLGFFCYKKLRKAGRGYITLDDFGTLEGMNNPNYEGEL